MKESMYDTQLVLKDAGLVAASAAATVGGEAAVLDLGGGLVEGKLYIDVSAVEVADDDELLRRLHPGQRHGGLLHRKPDH